jgi:gamma-tubulin complex component 3
MHRNLTTLAKLRNIVFCLCFSEELDKRAENLMAHSLTPKLESAIRATNAQYEDEDVLNRLDVKLLSACCDETGWDIFSLHYNFNGPIAMVQIKAVSC